MTAIRSFLFAIWLYVSMALYATLMSPALLMPHAAARGVSKLWARSTLFGLRWITGVKVDVKGLENRPAGAALVAAKHQSMLDVVVLLAVMPDSCFVLKKELMAIPFFGWFCAKLKMIPVDRSGHAKALKEMTDQARARLAEGRQIIIFPEGTRTEPGAPGSYKPGVAAIYRDLEGPCWLVATNSGVCWPAKGLMKYPGQVTFEFLPPLPAGLKRGQLMAQLQNGIETASTAMLPAPLRVMIEPTGPSDS